MSLEINTDEFWTDYQMQKLQNKQLQMALADTEALEESHGERIKKLEAELFNLRIKVAAQAAVIEKLRVALSETLECGEDGDWQSARRVISEALAATGVTE